VKALQQLKPIWLYLALIPLAAGPVLAHDAGLSSADLRFESNRLVAVVTLSVIDLTRVLAEMETRVPIDSTEDGKVSEQEFAGGLERFRALAADVLRVKFDGQPVPSTNPELTLDETNNCHIRLAFYGERPVRLSVEARLFNFLPGRHQQFLTLSDDNGKELGKKMLTPQAAVCEFDLSTSSVAGEPKITSFSSFLLLGVEHILTGYDHLLFLFALLLVCRSFASAIQIITCFTIAHSITLAAATFDVVQMSSRVVEPLIAASIVYVGVENLIQPDGPKGRWLLTFAFGLIHGLGFAGVLRDLGIAAGKTGVAVPLVAFNLGVELGQIAVASVLLPVIWRLRRQPMFLRRGVSVCSALVALAGTYWFVQRVWLE
jgi:hydrogenase/urease accessory protein HupE